ncbi:FecR domain-containing protein [Undibacterium sp. LX40W]|uniref:FecR domain-containing protein n=1 Tax=Undibacterium nitidum TaxID=2762298 RepID=A0A923HWQ8_9BURK|nr:MULTISPECIES: FecR domain-containing protein [Undibacterium]MBC3882789.1 FecR domain-containing protein [Undibacterium nitidum]MBC3893028.1 FecR domain-containing protein [Undibacterium sp. LX40W]
MQVISHIQATSHLASPSLGKFIHRFVSLAGVIGVILLTLQSAPSQAEKVRGKPGSTELIAADLVYYASERDTLMSISKQFTDTTSHWEAIGKRNRIGNERAIPIGSAVIIPAELLAEEAAPARVVALAGIVSATLKNGQEVAIALNSSINEGTQINTGKNGFVTLALVDDSRVSIPSNSQAILNRLRITKFTKSPRTEIKLLDGRVESQVTKLDANRGRFEVRSKLAIAGVRGTHFRVGVNDNGIANEVLEGGVAAGQAEKSNTVILPAGQGNIVTREGVGKPVPLLPAPTLVTGFQLQERPRLNFNLNPVEGASEYRAQISKDVQAQNVVAESITKDLKFQFSDLEDGDYFIRMTAIDSNHLEGLPNVTPFKLKAKPEPPFPLQPKHKVRSQTIEFKWAQSIEAKSYHLQVASDAQFNQIVLDQNQITLAEFSTDKISVGQYFWRVAAVAERTSGPDHGPFSNPQSFSVLPGQSVNAFVDNGANQLHFSWPSEPGQRFLVQIANEPEFKKPLLSKEVSDAQVQMPRPESGIYYIRVRATDADRFIGAFSMPQKFEVGLRWTTGTGESLQSTSGVVRPNVQ